MEETESPSCGPPRTMAKEDPATPERPHNNGAYIILVNPGAFTVYRPIPNTVVIAAGIYSILQALYFVQKLLPRCSRHSGGL